MTYKPNLGFIGLGIMGTPMSGHLADAGYKLTLYDINTEAAYKAAESRGNIKVAELPAKVAELSDIVITMLPSGKPVQETALGKGGLIEGFRPGSLLLDTSSSEPDLTIETAGVLKEHGIDMVDAPVSGARWGARAAELVFMAGGDSKSVSRVMPLLNIMGTRVFHLGPVGSGHIMKSINNLITAMTFMATAEGLVIGKNKGLDPDIMTDVINESTGMSWISKTQIKQRITSRKFDDPFKLELMIKDIGIAMGIAERAGLDIPLCLTGRKLWEKSGEFAGNNSSISEMVKWVEHMTGTTVE